MRVAAVVLTYNRKDLVKQCLQGILQQSRAVEAIVLVDNASTDGTPEALQTESYGAVVLHYLRLNENVGSAGGFAAGLQYAYEQGYDWFWLMDDDAIPTPEALEHLFAYTLKYPTDKLGGLISFQRSWIPEYLRYRLPKSIKEALLYGMSCPLDNQDELYISIDHCTLVCLLMPLHVVNHIGFPRKDLYFYADDFDYTLRIHQAGYQLFIVTDSIVDHQSAMSIVSDRQGTMRNPLRWYYYYRNNITTLITHQNSVGVSRMSAALIRLVCGGD